MMKHFYSIALFFLIPMLGISQDRESDSLALVSIYESLDGDNWPKNENWLSDMPLDEWEGVRMSNDRVDDLELKSNASAGIAGDFPLQVLELTELTTLELSNIDISGPIPASLAELTKMNRLVLQSCKLNGDLPDIFDQFTNLNTLILSNNELTGPLPDLPLDMFLVYIDGNQFSGSIPDSWTGSDIVALQLHNNNLTGNYDILTTFPKINKMNLSNNNWDESTLPTWIDDIPNLERFDCNNCNLVGDIPAEMDFSALENYDGMFISDNELSGDISLLFNNPDFGQKLFLRARNNNLSGELPIGKMGTFHELDVYNNRYTSMTAPADSVTYTVDIQFNNFSYEALAPIEDYIVLDSIIGVRYRNQNNLGSPDTIQISTTTDVTILAFDNHPNTTYQWYKSNQAITDATESELTMKVTDNSYDGKYYCRMENSTFPELNLDTWTTILEVDISTSTNDLDLDNLTLSPNPTNQLLHISQIDLDQYDYSIMSLEGKMIRNQQAVNSKTIDVSDLEDGAYVLSIKTENGILSSKIFKF